MTDPRLKAWRWPIAYITGCFSALLYAPLPAALIAGVLLLILEAVSWLEAMGREINLAGFLRIMVLLTMWVAPALAYFGAGQGWYTGHLMPIPAATWWSFAAPGVAAFNLALRLPWPVSGTKCRIIIPDRAVKILIPLGLAGQLALPWAPTAFRQVAHLGAQLVYVGMLYAIIAWPAKRWWWVLAGSAYAGLLALQTTVFGNGLMWILILFLTAVQGMRIPGIWRYGIAAAAGIVLVVLLSFKYEYRASIARSGKPPLEKVLVFNSMLWQRMSHPGQWMQTETIETIVNRFNQGYNTAQTMAWTPAHEPFARGETLLDDAKAVLAPRFLFPGKHRAGGFDNMKRFAGVTGRSYSMNIGIFGEAYVNFGITGGVACLFGYALLLGGLISVAVRRLELPWWPYLFIPALHVESDMGIVWNHIAKSGLVAVALIGLLRLAQKYG